MVDNKAATVPTQYARRAAAADEHLNETAAEARPGPMEMRMASMKQVVCISVGAFGEVNRATSALLNQIAEKGSKNPERFGCCHGQEQAKGVGHGCRCPNDAPGRPVCCDLVQRPSVRHILD